MATESYLIETAYMNLLELPLGSLRRARLQAALASLRDDIAAATKTSPERVQNAFEKVAMLKVKRDQQSAS